MKWYLCRVCGEWVQCKNCVECGLCWVYKYSYSCTNRDLYMYPQGVELVDSTAPTYTPTLRQSIHFRLCQLLQQHYPTPATTMLWLLQALQVYNNQYYHGTVESTKVTKGRGGGVDAVMNWKLNCKQQAWINNLCIHVLTKGEWKTDKIILVTVTYKKYSGVQGWLSGSFSDDAEQELWDALGSNPALHPWMNDLKKKWCHRPHSAYVYDLIVVIAFCVYL